MVVEHDAAANRFVVRLTAGDAVLSYLPAGAGVLDFRSTYVPPPARGQGIAGRLVRTALDYAREQGCRVIPSCWYVREWVEQNPDYRPLLVA